MEILPIQVLIDDFKKSDEEEYDWQDDEISNLMWMILEIEDLSYGIDFKVVNSKVKNLEGYHERELKVKVKRLSDNKIFKFKMHDRGFIGESATFDEYMEEKIKDMF